MTEDAAEPGRVDFRALTDDPQFANVERVMTGVRARFGTPAARRSLRRPSALGALVAHARPLAAAAAILIALSLAAVTHSATRSVASPQQTLATWVQANHVPTNGELLSTFGGYGR